MRTNNFKVTFTLGFDAVWAILVDMASYEAGISKFSKLEPFQSVQQIHLVQSRGLHSDAYQFTGGPIIIYKYMDQA